MNKRGVFFLVDALIAVSIIIVAVVLLMNFADDPKDSIDDELGVLNSFMNTLTQTQIRDLNSPAAYTVISQGLVEQDVPVYIAIADLDRRAKLGLSPEYARNQNMQCIQHHTPPAPSTDSRRALHSASAAALPNSRASRAFLADVSRADI